MGALSPLRPRSGEAAPLLQRAHQAQRAQQVEGLEEEEHVATSQPNLLQEKQGEGQPPLVLQPRGQAQQAQQPAPSQGGASSPLVLAYIQRFAQELAENDELAAQLLQALQVARQARAAAEHGPGGTDPGPQHPDAAYHLSPLVSCLGAGSGSSHLTGVSLAPLLQGPQGPGQVAPAPEPAAGWSGAAELAAATSSLLRSSELPSLASPFQQPASPPAAAAACGGGGSPPLGGAASLLSAELESIQAQTPEQPLASRKQPSPHQASPWAAAAPAGTGGLPALRTQLAFQLADTIGLA